MSNLVIVESAAKAKTIQKYLNSIPELKKYGDFTVMASLGHIRDLPVKTLGIDKDNWKATYVTIPGKQKIVDKLKHAIQKASYIYLAADLDMEGEAIAHHVEEHFKLPKSKTHRITFHEITKDALKQAVLHPRTVNMDMVEAQEARRMLDRVVGYELSPLLWHRFATSSLSAGRVQSAALKLLVDRMQEAQAHEPKPFWQLHGQFKFSHVEDMIETRAYANEGNEIVSWEAEKEIATTMKFISKKAKKYTWTASFEEKQVKRSPSAPFTTSTLQQEAYAKYNLPAKRTMQLAQALYESGYITYMRTDSPTLSQEAKDVIAALVRESYGDHYVRLRDFKARAANAQEAHEAIRPSKLQVRSKDIDDEGLTSLHKKLYDLIWRRTVASQMVEAVYHEIHIHIVSDCIPMTFKGKYSVLIEPGFLKVYSPDQIVDKKTLEKWRELIHKGSMDVEPFFFEAQGDMTRPPSLYNEPGLIKSLEKKGIGRPSTYATIIDKLFSRGYVVKGTNPQHVHNIKSFQVKLGDDMEVNESALIIGGTDTDRFVPSSLGTRVVEYLQGIVPFLLDVEFTASMEDQLDKIANGNKKKIKVLDEFYQPFERAVSTAKKDQVQASNEKKKRIKKNEEKKEITPNNIVREFENTSSQVVQTRYGMALYLLNEKRFVSLIPFLKWKNKTVEELTQKDAKFLASLPRSYEGTDRIVAMGRYGLYVKDGDQNIRLNKELWDDVYENKIIAKDISSLAASSTPSWKLKKKQGGL